MHLLKNMHTHKKNKKKVHWHKLVRTKHNSGSKELQAKNNIPHLMNTPIWGMHHLKTISGECRECGIGTDNKQQPMFETGTPRSRLIT